MGLIVDYLGRPIKTEKLGNEIAGPTMAGVRNVWHSSIANSLTPEYLAATLLKIEQGDTIEFLTLCEEMEERDLHYASELGKRKRAVTGLPVMVEAASDDKKDIDIADDVSERVVNTDEFRHMLPMVMDALGKGCSCTEIMWQRSAKRWSPSRYIWRDPRFFQFDLDTCSELRLRDEADLVNGVPLDPFKFIVHRPQIKMGLTIRGGLGRLACTAFMLKSYTVKDWWAFMEIFGIPWRIGKYDSSASFDQKTDLLTAVRDMGTDAACIMPKEMLIDLIEPMRSTGGDKLFLAAAEWVDEQVSKGVLGQTASAKGTPGRLGSEDIQGEVRQDIRIDDAGQLSATLRRDLIKPYVDLNHGPQERYPVFRIVYEEQEDLESLARSLPEFIDRGLPVQASVISDKFGLPEPEEGSLLLQPKTVAVAPTEEEEEGEASAARARDEAAVELMRKVRDGEPLTDDQRTMLLATMAAGASDRDGIDKMVEEELGEWRPVMDPVLRPLIDHMAASKDYPSMLAGLERVMREQANSSEFVKRLATMTFKARGLGDGTDDI